MPLRAIVMGAGFAGEGHTVGLREAGVEVVAMWGRTPEPAYAMAKKLGVEEVRFDWREAIEEFRPDIVSIATPAPPHRDMAIAAAERGCHVVCDKPLGLTAEEARAMLIAAERAGVKHAYAATHRYAPVYAHARELLSGGLIGRLREIEYVLHFNRSPLMPHHWSHRLSQGGGALFGLFTHLLGQVRRATGARVVAATGEARTLVERAPVGPEVHDARDRTPTDREQAEAGEWGVVDADQAFTVLLELRMPDGHEASALFQVSTMAPSPIPNHLACYGTNGAIYMPGGSFLPTLVEHFSPERGTWEQIPIPQRLEDALPPDDDRLHRLWNQLFREFVADVQGEGFAGYLTFRDGWSDNEIIDVVRSRKGWTTLPQSP